MLLLFLLLLQRPLLLSVLCFQRLLLLPVLLLLLLLPLLQLPCIVLVRGDGYLSSPSLCVACV